jgi:succinate dehydrogenase / fumarate reductase flavoprotein subunit
MTQDLLAPFNSKGGENPYAIHMELQDCMQHLVGIIRTESELKKALGEIGRFRERLSRISVEGNRQYNPGWHLALDLRTMLAVAEVCTLSALERKESRGGHTREDYPKTDPNLAKINMVTRKKNGAVKISQEPRPEIPEELKKLLEEQK